MGEPMNIDVPRNMNKTPVASKCSFSQARKLSGEARHNGSEISSERRNPVARPGSFLSFHLDFLLYPNCSEKTRAIFISGAYVPMCLLNMVKMADTAVLAVSGRNK